MNFSSVTKRLDKNVYECKIFIEDIGKQEKKHENNSP